MDNYFVSGQIKKYYKDLILNNINERSVLENELSVLKKLTCPTTVHTSKCSFSPFTHLGIATQVWLVLTTWYIELEEIGDVNSNNRRSVSIQNNTNSSGYSLE